MDKKKELVEVVFIMDRSGSMSGLEADTIGGFNAMLEKQKKESNNIIWSTVLFDHISEVIHDRVPVDKVKELDSNTYYVRDARRCSTRSAERSTISATYTNTPGKRTDRQRPSLSSRRMAWRTQASSLTTGALSG